MGQDEAEGFAGRSKARARICLCFRPPAQGFSSWTTTGPQKGQSDLQQTRNAVPLSLAQGGWETCTAAATSSPDSPQEASVWVGPQDGGQSLESHLAGSDPWSPALPSVMLQCLTACCSHCPRSNRMPTKCFMILFLALKVIHVYCRGKNE